MWVLSCFLRKTTKRFCTARINAVLEGLCHTFSMMCSTLTKRRKNRTAAVDRGSLFSEFVLVLDQLDGHDCLRNPWRGTNDYDVFEPNKNTNTISLYIKHAKTPLIGALCLKLWNPIIELDWRFTKSCGKKLSEKATDGSHPIRRNPSEKCRSGVTSLTDSGRPVHSAKNIKFWSTLAQ